MARDRNSGNGGMDFGGFALRLVAAVVLVLGTYNPSGRSAWHWISSAIRDSEFGPVQLIVLALLAIGWAIYWIATWRALGTLGVTLVAVFLGAFVWLLVDFGWIRTDSVSAITWIILVCLAALLAIGVSWSHLWRRMTGQYNVEDVDD